MPTNRKRFHIVLVPGFGGFDALGRIEYYAGVTAVFQRWSRGKPAVLHYFDNLPTAAVVTRAARLACYLAKRIARGEILPGDEIVLVGHSTGGLDIRQLLCDLDEQTEIHVDGGIPVPCAAVRDRIHRVVFLSVPHWGTKIADWVNSHPHLRKAAVMKLRAGVAGSQVHLLEALEERLTAFAAFCTNADIIRAAQDTIAEAHPASHASPQSTAAAHEAAAELSVYFRDMASDFHVIEDLTSLPPAKGPGSPAHFTPAQRTQELGRWRKAGIAALSYVTISRSPFRFESDRPAPVWDLTDACTYPEICKDPELSKGTDIAYRVCYRACAGGPFRPPSSGAITSRLDGSPKGPLEMWDNDGIVNTLSMPWPVGENILVAGDHLDIVGHYERVRSASGSARAYRKYDLLRSMPRFDAAMFQQIWTAILNFAIK